MQAIHFSVVLTGGHANFDVLGLLSRRYQLSDDYADYCGNGEASHYRYRSYRDDNQQISVRYFSE